MQANHTRLSSLAFRAKVSALQLKRVWENVRQPIPTLGRATDWESLSVVAEVKTSLWVETDPRELVLERGKVHNLRLVARVLDGTLIPAGQTFSFWSQVGRVTRRKGYVRGRQLEQGSSCRL